jgi:hypothetical protein
VRIAWVRWKDACFEQAENGGVVQTALIELDEVGWLVGENEEAVTLAMELEPDEEGKPSSKAGRARLHIPRVNIISMHVVEDVRKAFPKRTVVVG